MAHCVVIFAIAQLSCSLSLLQITSVYPHGTEQEI